MKKNIALTLLAALSMTLSLTACGETADSSISSSSPSDTTSSTGDSTDSSNSSSSSVSVDKRTSLEKAMAKDYSNMTVGVTTAYAGAMDGEVDTTGFTEYYVDGYTVVEDSAATDTENLYSFYHDYQGDSYLFFKADSDNKKNPQDAWLNKGVDDIDLGLENTYFDFDLFAENLDLTKASYVAGSYVISDEEAISKLNSTAFRFAWENDISYVTLSVNADGYLSQIIGLEDLESDKRFVKIQLADFGETISPATLPEAPNEDNVMEYWQYKGYDSKPVKKYIESMTIKASDSTTVDENGNVVLDIEKTAELESSYLPEDATETGDLRWHSTDESVATVSFASTTGHAIVHAENAGTCKIYVVATSVEGIDKGVKSNEITVVVNPLKEPDKDGLVYDLTFNGIVEDTGSVTLNNKLSNNLPVSVKETNVALINNASSNIFTGNTLIMDPGKQQTSNNGEAHLEFNFSDQQVSRMSFYYGLYYTTSILANIDYIKTAQIETRNADDAEWTVAYDMLPTLKSEISRDHKKLMEVSFDPAYQVRLTLTANMIGNSFPFAFNEVFFAADENCHAHVETPETVDVTAVSLTADSDHVAIGKTLAINAGIEPTNATDKTLTWKSSDETVATVDENGVVAGLKAGTTKITATSANGISSNELEIEVVDLTLPAKMLDTFQGNADGEYSVKTKLTITATDLTATVGTETYTLTLEDLADSYYVFKDEAGDYLNLRLDTSYDGHLLANGKLGSHTYNKYNSASYYLEKVITATSIKMSYNEDVLYVGDTVDLTVTLNPTNANDKATEDFTFTSSNENIAKVESYLDEEDYTTYYTLVAGNTAGTATITATNSDGITGTLEVTVKEKTKVTGITISAAGNATEVSVGSTLSLTATVTPTDAYDSTVSWSSSDTSIATVSDKGVVTGVKAGSVTITATAKDGSGVTGTINLTVTAAATTAIPAGFVGTWTGTDSMNGAPCTLVITADGTMTLSNGGAYSFTSTSFTKVSDVDYTFTDGTDTYDVWLKSSDTLSVTVNKDSYDGYTSNYSCGFDNTEFTKA